MKKIDLGQLHEEARVSGMWFIASPVGESYCVMSFPIVELRNLVLANNSKWFVERSIHMSTW